MLIKVSNYFINNGYQTFVLLRKRDSLYNLDETFKSNFTKIFYYGEDYYNFKNDINVGYLKNKYRFIKSINFLKKEVLSVIDEYKPNAIITFDSWDVAINTLCTFRPSIKKYYLQHSAIISKVENLSIKQKYDNLISCLFCGIYIIRVSKYPPFNNKNLTYLLWTKLWSDNINRDKYDILYLSKILIKNVKEKPSNIDDIQNILVILNKKRNIGVHNWELYADFYLKFFKENFRYDVTFKVHPDEDFDYCKNYFKGYLVVKKDVRINDFDLVLSHWSSFIFEASIYKVPFILINPNKKFNFKKWRLSHFPLIVNDTKQLEGNIEKIKNKNINVYKIIDNFIKISLGDDLNISINKLFKIISRN